MTADTQSAKSGAGDFAQPALAGVLAALVGYASTFTLVLGGLSHLGATSARQRPG